MNHLADSGKSIAGEYFETTHINRAAMIKTTTGGIFVSSLFISIQAYLIFTKKSVHKCHSVKYLKVFNLFTDPDILYRYT